jgi:hypothetical protein
MAPLIIQVHHKFRAILMATDREAVRTIQSASDDAAGTAKTAARATAGAADATVDTVRQTAERGADTAKQVAEKSSQEFGRLLNFSAEASQDAARQFNQNLDLLLQVGSVVASGYQSIISEWSNYAQQAARRNVDALNAILRVQSPQDLLRVEGDLLKDNVQDLLSVSARISELSAQFATEAIEKLDVRTQEAARNHLHRA